MMYTQGGEQQSGCTHFCRTVEHMLFCLKEIIPLGSEGVRQYTEKERKERKSRLSKILEWQHGG